MLHRHLVQEISTMANTTKEKASAMLESLSFIVSEQLKIGGKVKLPGIGIFITRQLKPKMGRNPKTGESVAVPAKKRVILKVDKKLKGSINSNS